MTESDLIDVSKISPEPFGITFTTVVFEYPMPGFTILTAVIFPLPISALSFAPLPLPVGSNTSNSGTEKYSLPPNCKFTELMIPELIIGFTCPSLPVFTVSVGFFSKFRTSEPYLVPAS